MTDRWREDNVMQRGASPPEPHPVQLCTHKTDVDNSPHQHHASNWQQQEEGQPGVVIKQCHDTDENENEEDLRYQLTLVRCVEGTLAKLLINLYVKVYIIM